MIGMVLMAAVGALTPVGAALWLRLYAPEVATPPAPATRRAAVAACTAVGVFVAGGVALAEKDAPGVLLAHGAAPVGLAVVCGALLYSDLLHRHLSLPLQATALLLALDRLRALPPALAGAPADMRVHLVVAVAFALLWIALALADRRAGLGDASALALVGLVAGPEAPLVVIAGMLPPLLRVLARRVGARDPQPLAGWLLAALLLSAPWTWR